MATKKLGTYYAKCENCDVDLLPATEFNQTTATRLHNSVIHVQKTGHVVTLIPTEAASKRGEKIIYVSRA